MPSEAAVLCPAWLCQLPTTWATWLPVDSTLRLAVYVALGLAVTTLLIMLQVLVLAEIAGRRQRRRQRFNEQWRPYFALCSLSDQPPAEHPPLRRGQRLWFLLQWNRAQLQLRGAARERMNAALRALGLDSFALRLLDGRVRARLIGLTCLRHLADPGHWEPVAPLVNHRSMIVSLAAAQTLVAMDPTRAMQLLMPLAATRRDWALPRLVALCQQAGPLSVTTPLLTLLVSAPEAVRQRMVSLLAYAEPRVAAPWARSRLEDGGTAEELQAALQCLSELGDPRDRMRILGMFGHAEADVRLSAVQAFRQLAGRDDAAVLLPLLADSSWWVRQAAADALAAMPGVTTAQLDALFEQVEDRYGRDALRRAIAERTA